MNTLATIIVPPSPFNFDLTASQRTHYQKLSGADVYVNGIYRRALVRQENTLLVSARQSRDHNHRPLLELSVTGLKVNQDDLTFASESMVRMFGLDVDMNPFHAILESDQVLSKTARDLYGLRPSRTPTVFEALIVAITSQQISNVIARLIIRDLIQQYGSTIEVDDHLYYAFPTPQAVFHGGVEKLRYLRLSTRKAEYIVGICTMVLEGELDLEGLRSMPNDEVVQTLCEIRGVGQWTADWVLLQALGRTDVFPAGDLALKRVLSKLYFGGRSLSEHEAHTCAQTLWAPHQGMAMTYLFAHLRQERMRGADLP